MSKLQKLPDSVLDAITPYLLTGETIEKSLLQDNKKPREIWLIKTNQAIILHGQQPDRPQPAIMVFALDEIPEIDYLQKIDDIQLIIYSSKNSGKAVFHFETSASKEVEKFLEDLGDLITFRYQNAKGKITVVQKALPIGSKERKVFGRGKQQEIPFLSKNKVSKSTETKSIPAKKTDENKPKQEEKIAVKVAPKIEVKPAEQAKEQPISKDIKPSEKATDKSKAEVLQTEVLSSNNSKKAEVPPVKTAVKNEPASNKDSKSAETKTAAGSSKSSIISHLQENPLKPADKEDSKPPKEIDYGNPVYFISVTIIATIVGFFCLSFFRTISKVVKYFKRG